MRRCSAFTRERGERLTSTPRGCECHKDILVLSNLVLPAIIIQHNHGAGHFALSLRFQASLVCNPFAQALKIPAPAIIFRFVALAIEPLQSWEALNTKPLPKFLVVIRIYFTYCDFVRSIGEIGGEFFVDRREILAMSTPGSKELDKSWLARFQDDRIKVGWNEIEDGRRCGDWRRCEESKSGEEEVEEHRECVCGVSMQLSYFQRIY